MLLTIEVPSGGRIESRGHLLFVEGGEILWICIQHDTPNYTHPIIVKICKEFLEDHAVRKTNEFVEIHLDRPLIRGEHVVQHCPPQIEETGIFYGIGKARGYFECISIGSSALHHDGIGLLNEVLERPVIRTIVQKHKPLNSETTVMGEKFRKEIHLISEDGQQAKL